jgi:hypothetical protein
MVEAFSKAEVFARLDTAPNLIPKLSWGVFSRRRAVSKSDSYVRLQLAGDG